MNKIRTIIVDDESKSRNILSNVLQKYFSYIEVVAECASGNEAYLKTLELNPALIFLDIEMPFGGGFEFLAKFDHPSFDVIFLTAYEQYSLKAIKTSPLDYLLKPLSIAELGGALEKVKARIQEKNTFRHYEALQHSRQTKEQLYTMAVPTHYGLEFLEAEEVVLLEAEGNYTQLYTTEGKKVLSTKLLKEYESYLPETTFFRAHHSHIINMRHIKKYYKGEGGHVVMSNGMTVSISKRKKKHFLEQFGE